MSMDITDGFHYTGTRGHECKGCGCLVSNRARHAAVCTPLMDRMGWAPADPLTKDEQRLIDDRRDMSGT